MAPWPPRGACPPGRTGRLAGAVLGPEAGQTIEPNPVNALTNVAFLLAALWAAVEARTRGLTQPILWILSVMAGRIGVGSFLFHTHANRGSELTDTLPIWSFVGLFVMTAMHSIGGLPLARGLRLAGIILIAVVLTIWLLGSGQYAPALLVLGVFSFVA